MISPRHILAHSHRLTFALSLMIGCVWVSLLQSQDGSPTQAEYTGASVPAGPSVNEFTGDFTYGLPILTVPGPNGSSYSMTLSYQAGANPNADVSWVGYGWSLNPGAIVRGKRGFPDDWDGEMIYHAKRPADYTISSEWSVTAELASGDRFDNPVLEKLHLNPGIESTRRYDSRTGYGDLFGISAGVSFLGNYAGLQFMNENGDESWSGVISPNLLSTASGIRNWNRPPSPRSYAPQPFSFKALWEGSLSALTRSVTSKAGIPITFASREFEMSPPATFQIQGETRNIGTKLGISLASAFILGGNIGAGRNVLTVQPVPRQPRHAYGYMRSVEALNDSTGVMDFYYEKDVPYILHDKLLPIPFSNADLFSVTGGGNFRLYNRNVGGFRQNALSSEIEITNEETAINIGALWGIGKRWGSGTILYDTRAWENADAPAYHSFTDEGDEPWFFRFSHDMGGSLLFDNDDNPVGAALIENEGLFGEAIDFLRINDMDRFPLLPADIRLQQEAWERPGRSGYVGFTLNKDMLLEKNNKYYRAYNRDTSMREYWITDRQGMPDQIGEFALYGAGDNRFVYGLPVYTRYNRTISLGLRNLRIDSAANIKHNLIAYRYLDEGTAPSVLGEEMHDPYAVAWLLTEITTPNYVDLTGNGPTQDDLGGWTRFHYVNVRGTPSKTNGPVTLWSYWRNPYNGLAYDPGELSDPEDDLGGYSEGFSEQYYLSKIETKTHVALFVLNDTYTPSMRRKDGYPQVRGLVTQSLAGDSTTTGAFYNGTDMPRSNDARYLDRIELYTKNDSGTPGTLLSTIRFEYDYSLRPNMPNSLPVHPDSSSRYGMLTLRKVWTESMDVRNNRIAPIIFGYEYRKSDDYAANVEARYPEITAFADGLNAADENPAYSLYDFDAWGNHHPGGAERLDRRFPYVPQNDTSAWDPAAWQLKWIKSSTGGEIQVQYEEDDYAFVHDRPAMAMVSLIERPGEEFGEQSVDAENDNIYYLRLSDIGVDSTDYWQVARVRELIERQMKSEKKLFFKFFYALDEGETDFDNPEFNSDYIEGYADLYMVGIQSMDSGAGYALYVKLMGYEEDGITLHEHGLPKTVCWDFVRKNKRGKLGPDEGVPWSTERGDMVAALAARYYEFDESNHCQDLDYARSYIRIPMITAKKGGGLRVKRLLSYDPGLEGDSALYGTEYHYEVYDQERNQVISSGVATNEPGGARDENPLVAYMPREEDDRTVGKVMAGRDRGRNEGPVGETLLPAASIGYSRVVTNPIHQGATTVGFGVTDFHTHRDFPFDARYNATGNAVAWSDVGGDDFRTPDVLRNFIFYNQFEDLVYRTQGYRFILNDMHGQVKRRLSNGGAYTPFESDWVTGAMTQYEYFQPGDSIPLLYRVGDSIRYGYPGKVMDVVHASRKNGSYIDDYKVEGDVGFWFLSALPYYSVNNSELSTHVTSKVVTYPAIVKGVTTYADGNYNGVENVAFDPRSGQPLLTRSRDAFHGLALNQSLGGHAGTYHSYSFPVINIHPEFDQAAGNEGALIASSDEFEIVKKKNGTGRPYLRFPAGNETRWLRKLTPGDLIELNVTDDDDDAGRYHVDAINDTVVWLLPSGLYNTTSDPSLSLVDEVVDLRVIRSGRANAPGAGIGSVTTYGETDTEAATGANFGWSGPGAAARLAFVDQLNDSLALGVGVFNATNVDTTLEFKLYTTGTCGTLGFLVESFALDVIDDTTILVASPDFTTPAHVDTLVHLGLGGWFALNDAGQIVFRSVGNLPSLNRWRAEPGGEQRVWNFTFCGDPVYRSVANVIAASAAGRMNDTVDYDGGGVGSVTNQPNAYEKGERGRWSPRTGYAYKTGVTEGSRPVAGERTYKNAGVFDDFSLYNWHEPVSSDMTRWFGLDSITAVDRHARPVGSIDMLGHASLVRFGYGADSALLPTFTAWNAEEGSVAFESFESYDVDAFDGDLTDQVAHSGELSLTTDSNEFTIPLIATEHVLNKGWLVRFWMYPLSEDSVRIRLFTGGSPANYLVSPSHRIARAGEWALYEYKIDTAALNSFYSLGDSLDLWFQKAHSGDVIRIDDIKIQPADAVVAGYVYDRELFRPVAAFGDQNFGIYPQYDAEGKTIRTIVETSRGVKTVGESHIHLPGATRDWLGDGAPFTPGSILDGGSPASGISDPTDPNRNTKRGAQFDLLNLQIGIGRQNVTLFGLEPSKLREFVQQKVGEFNALTKDDLMLLDRYEELNKRYTELQESRGDITTDEARAELDNELEKIALERDTLLKRLGIDTQ